MKVFLKLLAGLVLLTYLILTVVKFRKGENRELCQRVRIEVADSSQASFVSAVDVMELLKRKKLYPENIPLNEVRINEMESLLKAQTYISNAQCYKAADGTVNVIVWQRVPVIHVINNEGSNYYIDADGKTFPKIEFTADVAVATGHITHAYAQKYLAKIGTYLQKNPFWNAQIEQLNVLPDSTMEMIPRVGNHVVVLGLPEDIEKKFDKLMIFYQKVLNKVGWNKYETINMEYDNQIVCVKKE